jgi:hypothetical protein
LPGEVRPKGKLGEEEVGPARDGATNPPGALTRGAAGVPRIDKVLLLSTTRDDVLPALLVKTTEGLLAVDWSATESPAVVEVTEPPTAKAEFFWVAPSTVRVPVIITSPDTTPLSAGSHKFLAFAPVVS